MLREYYHLDLNKGLKQRSKELGEHFRRITTTFYDKEVEDAMMLARFIAEKQEPEDGFSYEEIALVL